jgi:hypothetical protein
MRRSLVVALVLLAIGRSPAVAQTCMGMASYSSGPVRVAGHGSFVTGANQFGGSLGYGLPGSVFADVGLSTTSYDGADATLDVSADAGYQMQLGGKAQLCPVASLGYSNGPDAGTFNSSMRSAGFGLAIGAAMGTSRMQIVPTAGLGLEYSRVKAEDTGLGISGEASDAYGLAQVGVGLVFNSNITVRPGVAIPLGLNGSDPTFGLTVGFNFGPKR